MESRREPVEVIELSELVEDDPQCPVCLDVINDESKLEPCGHLLCNKCIFQWINVRIVCPVCRQRIRGILFRCTNRYDIARIDPVLSLTQQSKDFLYRDPVMFKFAVRCLNQLLVNVELPRINCKPILKFADIQKIINSSCTNTVTSQFFRGLVYYCGLAQHKENDCILIRDFSLRHFRENQVAQNRLIEFIKAELKVISMIYSFEVEENIYWKIQALLLTNELASSDFHLGLRSLIKCCIGQSDKKTNFCFKLYTELCNYAQSELNTPLEYSQNTSYIFSGIQDAPQIVEVITLSESDSSDSEIEIISDLTIGCKRGREDNPTPGPSGISFGRIKRQKVRENVDVSNGTTYCKRDFHEMRRIIRYASDSEYFFQKLLVEIKKKFYGYETILKAPAFHQFSDFFKDIFNISKVYRIKTLDSIKNGTIEGNSRKNSISSFLSSTPNLEPVTASSSESISEQEITVQEFEKVDRAALNDQLMKEMSSPSSSINRLLTPQLQTIRFENHLYSDSD